MGRHHLVPITGERCVCWIVFAWQIKQLCRFVWNVHAPVGPSRPRENAAVGMNPSTHRLPPPQVVSFVYERGWRQGFAWAGEVQRRAGQQGGAAGCCAAGRTRSCV